jgi:endonuclease-3
MTSQKVQHARAMRIVRYLKKAYPEPKSELKHATPFQFVVAVMLSAQCTDKLVNKVTETLFKKYKTPRDFANANPDRFAQEIARVSFFRTKAKHVIAAANIVEKEYAGKVPNDVVRLQKLPGVGYKTAHVVVGELFGEWPGIPTDTHVKRFARKFDLTTHTDLGKISKDLEALVPEKDWKYVNNGLVLYGRYICKANKHDCAQHPLTKLWPPAADRWPRAH